MSMHTYSGKPNGDDSHLDSREWMFAMLASDKYRARAEQLAGLELRRRPDCEPCLQSLVTGKWTPETAHHMGWCDSCRTAEAALGTAVVATGSPRRRRAVLLALAAGLVIATPLLASQLLDDPFGQREDRGGVAHAVPQKPVPRSKPTDTKPTGTKPTGTKPTGTKPTGTKPAATHRGGHSASDQRALPHTT
jgi:hypothetical protein